MELITSEEVRNRVDQLMKDESRVCRAVTLTFKVTLAGAHGLPQSLPWWHIQRQTTAEPVLQKTGKSKYLNFQNVCPHAHRVKVLEDPSDFCVGSRECIAARADAGWSRGKLTRSPGKRG